MDEKKTNYLKELKNNTSILLSVVLGIIFGLILTMVDKFNMVSKFIARFVKDVRFYDGVMTGLYAIVLSVIAVMFLIFIINSFKKNVTKHDFVLLVYDFGILSYFILSCAVLKTTGARFVIILVLTIIAILLTAIRFFTVKEINEEKVLKDEVVFKFLERMPYHIKMYVRGVNGEIKILTKNIQDRKEKLGFVIVPREVPKQVKVAGSGNNSGGEMRFSDIINNVKKKKNDED